MQDGRQILIQQQKQTLSPKMIQSLNLMTLPFADLREKILDETERNPALEVLADPSIVREPPQSPQPGRDTERMPRLSGRTGAAAEEKSEANREFLENGLSRRETLQEHLEAGLGEISLPPETNRLASLIIQNLDENGFHLTPPESLPGGGDAKRLAEALDAVRRLDPPGCATADFRESLAVQAEIFAGGTEDADLRDLYRLLADVLRGHFSWIEKPRAETLVRNLKKERNIPLTTADGEKMLELLRALAPFPGRAFPSGQTLGEFSGGGAQYIVPDITVSVEDGEISLRINEEEIPVVGLSPFFLKLKEDRTQEKAARDFAGESLREARWFMDSLKRRNLTVLKVARTLAVFQKAFFLKGPKHLQPMRLKDIADETGLHEATVSRATAGKYLQCAWGIFELRYFFSGKAGAAGAAGVSGARPRPADGSADSEGKSKQGVKALIEEIVAGAEERLTDQAIADILARRGVKIARRTVAKYRGEMDIGSSFARRG